MRMPWVQCSISSDQYCIDPLIKATTIVTTVAGISPCYRGRNGSLPSIGWKGRFLRVENPEKKLNRKRSK